MTYTDYTAEQTQTEEQLLSIEEWSKQNAELLESGGY